MLPVISVIIPTFNRKRLVTEAINSVLRQQPNNYEVIVVDDGSTDQTVSYLSSLDLDIKIISTVQGGPAKARNVGIKHALGEFICFLDSDDLWLLEKLRLQYQYFLVHPNVALVYTNEYFQAKDKVLETRFDRVLPQRTFRHPAFVDTCPIHTSSVMVRKTVFDELGYFNEDLTMLEDSDMWNRISERFEFGFIEEPLVIFRWEIDTEHIMHKRNLKRFIGEARKYLWLYEQRRKGKVLSFGEKKAITDSYAMIGNLESELCAEEQLG